jgi:ABC-type antimicrobial peptide transport system permease subunit
MIWIGIIIGICAGMVLTTLLYTPLVDKVKALELRMMRDKELIDEFVKTLRCYETQNDALRSDLDMMQKLMPPEVYARYFDAPFNN